MNLTINLEEGKNRRNLFLFAHCSICEALPIMNGGAMILIKSEFCFHPGFQNKFKNDGIIP